MWNGVRNRLINISYSLTHDISKYRGKTDVEMKEINRVRERDDSLIRSQCINVKSETDVSQLYSCIYIICCDAYMT